MRTHRNAMLAAAMAMAIATGAFAQTVSPRDADRPPAELTTPPPSPRDEDRRDVEKDRNDADLAIERDKCGDLDGPAKDRCIRAARYQSDRMGAGRYAAPSAVAPGMTPVPPVTPTAPQNPANTSDNPAPNISNGPGTAGARR